MENKRYLEVPGRATHELPPLLVRYSHVYEADAGIVACVLPEAEDMVSEIADGSDEAVESRKYDLAVQLVTEYRKLLAHWCWGDSIQEWIRQCEITFESEAVLRHLLGPDLWPHASRASFATLLEDKRVPTQGVEIKKAVGYRLTFRQPPPIDCFTNQYLFYLNSVEANNAYQTWANLVPQDAGLLPPDRFFFQVLDLGSVA